MNKSSTIGVVRWAARRRAARWAARRLAQVRERGVQLRMTFKPAVEPAVEPAIATIEYAQYSDFMTLSEVALQTDLPCCAGAGEADGVTKPYL